MADPLVSVATPFYNTAPYLAECIESVLAQYYRRFEYLLVNNHSTDGSRDIAARYAARDSRIRLIDNPSFVGQVENYNGALAAIAPDSRYAKIVQADDAVYPACLARMVEVAERHPNVGLVSSYRRRGDEVVGSGMPAGVTAISGRDACRMMLLDNCYLLGSPTTLLYRADIVRSRQPFYALGRQFEDTEAGYEILLESDLGFVHDVLSFSRRDNESIMSSAESFNSSELSYIVMLDRYGAQVLTAEELATRRRLADRSYHRFLGRAVLRLQGRRFWTFHARGLRSIGRPFPWRRVMLEALLEPFRAALKPRETFERALTDVRRRMGRDGN